MNSPSKNSLKNRIQRALRGASAGKIKHEELSFRIIYDRFREILVLNDSLHQLIVDVDDKIEGRAPFLIEGMIQKTRQGMLDVLLMVKDLNQISDNRHTELYAALDDLNKRFEFLIAGEKTDLGALTIPLSELRIEDTVNTGMKMAALGEVKNVLGLNIPDGFAITTAAFNLFMSENGLWEKAYQLKRTLANYGEAPLAKACREVQENIIASPVPENLKREILEAYDRMAKGAPALVAMRSSAVGEDLASSSAGQYYSELNVGAENLVEAYKTVLASLYKPHAIIYRFERGQSEAEATMAVGCLAMIQPRCGGVLFSRDFREPNADRIEISFTRGLADGVVQGEKNAEQKILGMDEIQDAANENLSADELKKLYEIARGLENHFDKPQDIEWAIDQNGRLFIIQSRQMVKTRHAPKIVSTDIDDSRVLLSGGSMACPGAGSGPTVIVLKNEDMDDFSAGAVAVARHATPAFSRIMTKAAAIVTEIGSPIGHMAILAREFGVPAIVGLTGATKILKPNQTVTVDADNCRVYDGVLQIEKSQDETPSFLADSPSVERLRLISKLVVPLRLIDPNAPEFKPSSCQSLHDFTRYIHEKLYETMFKYSDQASRKLKKSYKLKIESPIETRIFDLGGGVKKGAGKDGFVLPEDIVSIPLKAMINGMTDSRIDWKKPRAVSAAGFLSVMGENMMGPPTAATDLGSVSFAVISDVYMNFGIKAGYHFSTIDAYCDKNKNNNYINFRFGGGGAGGDRRARRLVFLTEILSRLDFITQVRGDLLAARLEKPDKETVFDKLTRLGLLTLCSRQLDMLMNSDSSPAYFAKAFIEEDFNKF